MKRWQLQEAKNRFSEVVTRAEKEGPQWVTKHGKDAVVVVSASEYQRTAKAPKKNFVEFLLNMPKIDIEFDADRKKSRSRNFKF